MKSNIRSIKGYLSSVILLTIFAGCSGKYQTNKLPDEEKVFIPKSNKEDSRYWLKEEPKKEFKKLVIDEFNDGYEVKNNKSQSKGQIKIKSSGIWSKGYEIDRKRY